MKNEAAGRSANRRDETSKTVKLRDLLGTDREVLIEHDGDRYSLRLTSKGKLLLTK